MKGFDSAADDDPGADRPRRRLEKSRLYQEKDMSVDAVLSRKYSELRLGFIPLAMEGYWKSKPELKQKSIDFARVLEKYLTQFGCVYSMGLVDSTNKAEECCLYLKQEDVDVIIVVEITFSLSGIIIPGLLKSGRPLIVWNTQKDATLAEDLSLNDFYINHGLSGVPCLTNVLVRNKAQFTLISGHLSDRKVDEEFNLSMQAISALKGLWGSRVGIIGHPYSGMLDFSYDATSLMSQFGVNTVHLSENEIVNAFKNVSDKEIASLAEIIQKQYTISRDFKDDEFNRSLRLACALETVVKDKQLDAVANYCQALFTHPEIGVVPCLGTSLLMQKGVQFSCEGDVPSAVACMVLRHFTEKTTFSEMWSNDFKSDEVMMGHCGQQNLALFAENPESVMIRPHPWWEGCCGRGASLEMKMPPGEITIVNLSPIFEGKWRLTFTEAEIVDKLPRPFGAPNFTVRFQKPLAEFLNDWTHAGPSHHIAVAYGKWGKYLLRFAEFAELDCLEV